MAYCSGIVIDFGSTNSGCARVEKGGNDATYRIPVFIQGNATYAKDSTWFYVRPDFWKRILEDYSQLQDSDFNIKSRAFPLTKNPNIVWGRNQIKDSAQTIETEGWIGFKYFKMNLYHNEGFKVNGMNVPVGDVVRLFLRILKIECLNFEKGRRNRDVTKEEIQWGITIPAIWGDRERKLMTEIAIEVYGEHVRVLSEPEGPILSALVHATSDSRFSLKKGRVTLVADVGGGTTDITLVEEVSDDAACEYPLRVIAATDGVGVGGNNVDEAYWRYILRVLSKGRKNFDGSIVYDCLSDEQLKETLLYPFTKSLRSYIEMEDAWLEYKHGQKTHIQFHPEYLRWLNATGHNEVYDYLTQIMIGIEEIDSEKLKQAVFMPTYNVIVRKIKDFLEANRDKIPDSSQLCIVVKAGGMSLSGDLRDLIDREVNDMGLKFTSASLGVDSQMASGSILDGACIILLNRKVINRKAPCNIFYDMNANLFHLRTFYKNLGVDMPMSQLEDLMTRDKDSGALNFEMAIPVGIKGEYLKDHKTSFYSQKEEQENITFHFYGMEDGYIVLPHRNPLCWILGEFTFKTRDRSSFVLVMDFNEFPNNNNFHYFITSEDTGEVMAEGNIPIRIKD